MAVLDLPCPCVAGVLLCKLSAVAVKSSKALEGSASTHTTCEGLMVTEWLSWPGTANSLEVVQQAAFQQQQSRHFRQCKNLHLAHTATLCLWRLSSSSSQGIYGIGWVCSSTHNRRPLCKLSAAAAAAAAGALKAFWPSEGSATTGASCQHSNITSVRKLNCDVTIVAFKLAVMQGLSETCSIPGSIP